MFASSLTRRRTAVAVVAVAAIGVLSGCGVGDAASGNTAARIGNATISSGDVIAATDRGLAGETPATRAQLTREHLTTLIRLELVRAIANKQNVTISEAELAKTWAEFDEGNGGRAGLEKAAAQSGVAASDLPAAVQLATYLRLLQEKLGAAGPVTDAELEVFRNANAERLADRAQAAHILVKDEALANSLLAQIKGGADFAELAKQHSVDETNKDKGGDLGVQPKGSYVAEFEDALWAAKKGDIVGPVKTEFGYHIIKIVEIQRFEDIKEDVRKAAVPSVGGARLFDAIKAGTPVTVNARFGKWNPETLKVESPDISSEDPSAPKGWSASTSAAPVLPTQ